MPRAATWFLFLILLLPACPEKSDEELGVATPIDAPVEATPVLLPGVETQVPEAVEGYQILMIEWQGMKPHAGVFERFVRGKCYSRATYAFAEGGILVQVSPLYRSAETGTGMNPKEISYTEALQVVVGPKQETSRHQRDSLGALSWVWQELEGGNEKIWNFTYPEPGTCVPPAVLARQTIPAKMKPALRREGPLPGETPHDPSRLPLAPMAPPAEEAATADPKKEAGSEATAAP